MLAFEVFVNGTRICTAGVGEYCVMSSILSLLKKRRRRREMWLEVGGIPADGADGDRLYVGWIKTPVSTGDEIRIKVIEKDEVDPPKYKRQF
jgi:hypothetical protein